MLTDTRISAASAAASAAARSAQRGSRSGGATVKGKAPPPQPAPSSNNLGPSGEVGGGWWYAA